MAAPRLLLLLGQSPFDPTSGAAQSTRIIAEVLARTGFDVRALATTACEGDPPGGHGAVLAELAAPSLPGSRPDLLRVRHADVEHALVSVEPAWKHRWESRVGAAYDAEFERLLAEWAPQVVLTYGGDPGDLARRQKARAAGAAVVFALHNLAYRRQPPPVVDAFLAPTRFLAQAYGDRLAAPITVLRPPLDPERIVAAEPDPRAIGFINPEPAKGATLVAQLAERLGRLRPDIPLLVVGGRTPAEGLVVAGRDIGLDLTRFPNLLQAPPTARVCDVWGALRVVLMPSIVREAAGRCALEGMLNGVVPLVSNQGGLAEIVDDAGIRLPAPPPLEGRARRVPAPIVDAWWQALVRLIDAPDAWRVASAACRERAAAFTMETVAPAYDAWFRALVRAPSERPGVAG